MNILIKSSFSILDDLPLILTSTNSAKIEDHSPAQAAFIKNQRTVIQIFAALACGEVINLMSY